LVRTEGDPEHAVLEVAAEHGARHVHCTRDWSPAGRAEELRVAEALDAAGVSLEITEGQLLVPPDALATRTGGAYRVFTPYHRAWATAWAPTCPHEAPESIPSPSTTPPSGRDHRPRSASPRLSGWQPGEDGALVRLERFLAGPIESYDTDRDRPDLRGTSELSPHLAFGEISPRRVAWEASRASEQPTAEPFLRQLAWREFASHVLHHFPHTETLPLRAQFADFPWSDDEGMFEAWRTGMTGYPLVDAGMRQLAATGWMHNRVRLACGSFLAKDLLIPWQRGLSWFGDSLFDHDAAANAFNWQWVAGSGADAAPYFRIFSPIRQGERFDPDGAYVRQWVPELEAVPARWIHRPWDAPGDVLREALSRSGSAYPERIVDHADARVRALAAFGALRS
jgi:deoxyribodipyrimidine photo-lyase